MSTRTNIVKDSVSLVWMAISILSSLCLCGTAHSQPESDQSTIAYRLVNAKTMHFDDSQKAEEHLRSVQNLGCEVIPSTHDGHGDLSYWCPQWRALTVANEELAHQWEEWLHGSGFETLHGHAEDHGDEHEEAHEHGHDGEGHEEVTYRCPNWVTLSSERDGDSQELVAIAKGLGCEVRETQHGGRVAVSVRCAQPKHIDCDSHEAAEFWQQWLTKTGFEASHND